MPPAAARLDLTTCIRDVPDFPKPGIIFKDITPLLGNPEALHYCIETLAARFRESGVTKVAGIESRGFIFAPGIALALGAGFIPIRKPGKLPWQVRSVEYQLEYGSDRIEMHVDAVEPADRVLLIDDVLATGGTLDAACRLIIDADATVVGAGVVVDLAFLNGANKVPCPVTSLQRYQ
jgi:adenine phosphoribosyltransferase